MKKILLTLLVASGAYLQAFDDMLLSGESIIPQNGVEKVAELVSHIKNNPVDVDGWGTISEQVDPVITSVGHTLQQGAEKATESVSASISFVGKVLNALRSVITGKSHADTLPPLQPLAIPADVTPKAPITLTGDLMVPNEASRYAELLEQAAKPAVQPAPPVITPPAQVASPHSQTIPVQQNWADRLDNTTFAQARTDITHKIGENLKSAQEGLARAYTYSCGKADTAYQFLTQSVIPTLGNMAIATKNGAYELGSSVWDAAGMVGNTLASAGKFSYDHPQVSAGVVAALAARYWYASHVVPGRISLECRKLDRLIVNPYTEVAALSTQEVNGLQESLLWHAGIYYRVNYAPRISRYMYAEELRDIQAFATLVQNVKAGAVGQAHLIPAAAQRVKDILKRRLTLSYAALVS